VLRADARIWVNGKLVSTGAFDYPKNYGFALFPRIRSTVTRIRYPASLQAPRRKPGRNANVRFQIEKAVAISLVQHEIPSFLRQLSYIYRTVTLQVSVKQLTELFHRELSLLLVFLSRYHFDVRKNRAMGDQRQRKEESC